MHHLPMLRHIAKPFDAGRLHGACGFSPLVTAWEMTAWRFSFSSSISRRCSATSPSIFAVSRSRNASDQDLFVDGGMGSKNSSECSS